MVLEKNCKIKTKEEDDAETRKFAVKAIEELVTSLGVDNALFT